MRYRGDRFEQFPEFDPVYLANNDWDQLRQQYDYALVWGHNMAVFREFERHDFALVHRQGHLRIFENREPRTP